MFPIINLRETGINLRRIMDKRGISAKDVQQYLNLVDFMIREEDCGNELAMRWILS